MSVIVHKNLIMEFFNKLFFNEKKIPPSAIKVPKTKLLTNSC